MPGLITAAVAGLVATAPVHAADARSEAFVSTYAEACLPHRLDYDAMKAHLGTLGWEPAETSDHPELAAAIGRAEAEIAADPDSADWGVAIDLFKHETDLGKLFVVIDRVDAPDIITLIGCYLYDFDATAPIDPQAVTDLLDHPLAYETETPGTDYSVDPALLVSHVWGPPAKLPRQFDTYLIFVPEHSTAAEQTGLTGLVLKSSASEPDSPEQLAAEQAEREAEAATIADLPKWTSDLCIRIATGDAGAASAAKAAGFDDWNDAPADAFNQSQYLYREDDLFGQIQIWSRLRTHGGRLLGQCTATFDDFGSELDLSAFSLGGDGGVMLGDDGEIGLWHLNRDGFDLYPSVDRIDYIVTFDLVATGPLPHGSPSQTQQTSPEMEVSN